MAAVHERRLPVRLTSFVGRVRELEQARAALAETRLLTLTGAGGAGKTRLALELAGAVDEVWFVELAALGDSALVGEALAAVLGVRPLPGATAIEASCSYLAERRAVIVLDNCEHLLAACSELVEALLRGCQHVTVLTTSRTPLEVEGETAWRVPPLNETDGVHLFVERARKARPTLAPDADAAAVKRICVSLDGLPLAIELAAARVRMLSLEQIAAGIADRFHLLTGATRSVPRHQTLRASVDWSHELLSEQERILFRRLSVFAGGFTLEACEPIGAGDALERGAILDLLASLVDKSLVVVDEHGAAVRYRMLETVRQYAAERLADAGEADTTRGRHLDTFLALAEQLSPELERAAAVASLQLLDADAMNLAAALDYALHRDGEKSLRLCAALMLWWQFRGLFTTAERAFARALAAADPAPSSLRARVLWGRTHVLLFAGSYAEAITTGQTALAMARELRDGAIECRVLTEIGAIQVQPDPVGAKEGLGRACELARACGDEWCLLHARLYLGIGDIISDRHAEAERGFGELLRAAEQRGALDVTAFARFGLTVAQVFRCDFELAAANAERAFAAAREIGEPVSEGLTEVILGWADAARGRHDAVVERLEASRERLIASGAGLPIPYVETTLAIARAALGDPSAARTALEGVLATGADFGRGLALATLMVAELALVLEDADAAERRAAEGREIGERLRNPLLLSWSDDVLARVASACGEYRKAESLLHDALAARVEHRLLLFLPQTLDGLAEVAAGVESYEEAARILGAAQRVRSDLGITRWTPGGSRYAALERSLLDAGFEAAHTRGASLSPDEAVAWLRRARGERKRPARGWESLTPTELQVVALVSGGLTNPQIGQRMFISRGTVKVHLSHIFAKLGISSRAELAAEATRRGDAAPA